MKYVADVRLIYRQDGHTLENSTILYFEAKDPRDAMKGALRWGEATVRRKNSYREDGDPEWKYVGSLQLFEFVLSKIQEDGTLTDPRGKRLADWKVDYPGKFEDWLPAEDAK